MRLVRISVPKDMVQYVMGENEDQIFSRNAMILYPLIQNGTISHGRAAEILGVCKTDLIEFYDAMGIPYLNQGKEELLEDVATIERQKNKSSGV